MLLNRVIYKYCTEEAGKEVLACARTPSLRLREVWRTRQVLGPDQTGV